MKKETYDVTGMSCAACSSRVEKAVSGQNGVRQVSVNLLKNSMVVEYDESALKLRKRERHRVLHAEETLRQRPAHHVAHREIEQRDGEDEREGETLFHVAVRLLCGAGAAGPPQPFRAKAKSPFCQKMLDKPPYSDLYYG